MKTTYITLVIFAILIVSFASIYFINIPSPSKTIVETYILDLK